MGSAHRAGWFRGECFMLPSAAPPLVAGATTFLHGKASHTILRSLALPYESCSLATPQAGAQQPVLKLEQLMRYQARGALLSHRFSGGEGGAVRHQRGKRPTAANHRTAIPADESKGTNRNRPGAGSWKLIAFASTGSGSFPPIGIYYRLPQMRRVPRFFAGAQNDCEGGKGST